MSWIDAVHFDDRGLVPVIAQDACDGTVLMLAWASREALLEAQASGRGCYWSRSRGRLWRKGEESGNVQELSEILLDCDGDAVIYKVRQVGGCACHTGHRSCFYRTLADGLWQDNAPAVQDPSQMYASHKEKTP